MMKKDKWNMNVIKMNMIMKIYLREQGNLITLVNKLIVIWENVI